MELALQFGWGMRDHTRDLLAAWGGGTVILSPRDLATEQLLQVGRSIRSLSRARVLIDPQFYVPHADHPRLTAHQYWPSKYDTSTFFGGKGLLNLLEALADC